MGRFQAAATRASAAHCPSGPMKAMVELLSLISVMRRMANAVSPSFPTIHVPIFGWIRNFLFPNNRAHSNCAELSIMCAIEFFKKRVHTRVAYVGRNKLELASGQKIRVVVDCLDGQRDGAQRHFAAQVRTQVTNGQRHFWVDG